MAIRFPHDSSARDFGSTRRAIRPNDARHQGSGKRERALGVRLGFFLSLSLPRGALKMPAAETQPPGGGSRSVVDDAGSENALVLSRLRRTTARLAKPFATVRATLSAKNRALTLMLWFVFFAVAFLYYGVVLLTTEIHVDAAPGRMEGGGIRGGDDALRCTGHGSPDVSSRAFLDIFVSAVAELPGLAFCAVALDAGRLGRRRTLGSSLVIAAACVLVLTGHRAIAPAAPISHRPRPSRARPPRRRRFSSAPGCFRGAGPVSYTHLTLPTKA